MRNYSEVLRISEPFVSIPKSYRNRYLNTQTSKLSIVPRYFFGTTYFRSCAICDRLASARATSPLSRVSNSFTSAFFSSMNLLASEHNASYCFFSARASASTFSTIIDTYSGNRTVSQYVEEKRLHAVELFSRQDFPADLDMLKSAMGVLFNYFGLRSICAMYATDYNEKIDNAAFLNHITVFQFAPVNRHLLNRSR